MTLTKVEFRFWEGLWMRARLLLLLGVGSAIWVGSTSSTASETQTYGYDPLGRLLTIARSGGPISGTGTSICFDRAGNRTSYFVGTTAAPACPIPAPTPTPTPNPSVNVAISATATGAEGGTVTFTVTKTGSTGSTTAVNYATANNTASSGLDFTAKTGILSFAPSETSKTIAIPIAYDAISEGTETFYVALSTPNNATITAWQGTASITDGYTTLMSPTSFSGVFSNYVLSQDGRFKLIMQHDGNLVLYMGGTPLWASNTSGNTNAHMEFQSDGNLVVYKVIGGAAWSSGTGGNPGARLTLQNDGNLVLFRSNGTVAWQSNTCCH